MKAAIYCRVSTEDQEREGTSLQSQLDACLNYCQEKGYDVAYRFSEAYSGLVLERPKLDELRELVRADEIDVVVVYCLDRLSRDPTHGVILTQELEKHRVTLEAVTEDVDSSDLGKLISYIRGYAAKLEAEKIRERTMRGKRERVKSGKLPAGRGILFGYGYDKDREINVANNDLETVRMIGEWLIQEGIFLNEACRRLMEKGIPAPKGGKQWSRGTIGRIMRNSSYAGRSYAYKTKIEGKKRIRCSEADHVLIPNAVDKVAFTFEEWELIQQRLDRNRELSPRNQKLDYLLTGRIFCKQCGRRYYGVPVHGTPYYRCSGRIKLLSDKRCSAKTINAKELDEAVWNEVAEALKKPRTILAGLQELKGKGNQEGLFQSELDQAVKRLKALDKEQERLLQWALKGFPEDTVVKENEKINRERVTFQGRIRELGNRLEQALDSHFDIEKIEEWCKVASENLPKFGLAEKKLALETFKIKVWVDHNITKLDGVLPVPDEVLVVSQHS